MNTFADGLQYLDVYGRGTPIVPIILELCIAADTLRTFWSCQRECWTSSDAWDDVVRVEGEDGAIDVDWVGIEDLWEFERW